MEESTILVPEIIEIIPGKQPEYHQVDLARVKSLGDTGLHIGVNPEGGGLVIGKSAPPSARRYISRTQATLYYAVEIDNGLKKEVLKMRDGNGNPSSNGIWVAGKMCTRPVTLFPGAEVDLVPRRNDYRCFLEWAIPQDSLSQQDCNPTSGFQSFVLQGELDASNEKIADLEKAIQQLEINAQYQDVELRQQKKTNENQSKIIGRHYKAVKTLKHWLLGLAAFMVLLGVAALGLDVETIESTIKIIGLLMAALGASGAVKTWMGEGGD